MASVTWSAVVSLVIVVGINLVVGSNETYGLSLSCCGKSCSDIYPKNPEHVECPGNMLSKLVTTSVLCIVT